MSSGCPGARPEGPHKSAKAPQTGSGDTERRGPGRVHRWVVEWEEPLGRMWVCQLCGRSESGWQKPL